MAKDTSPRIGYNYIMCNTMGDYERLEVAKAWDKACNPLAWDQVHSTSRTKTAKGSVTTRKRYLSTPKGKGRTVLWS